VAVESNLGTNERGSVYVSAEECEEFEFSEQPEAPYAYSSADRVPPQSEPEKITIPLTFLEPDMVKDNFFGDAQLPSVEFDVHWVTALASKPIGVDLIVDFGNTRTTCLLLEDTPDDDSTGEQALVRRVQSLRFNRRGTSFDKDSGETIINSWFMTHETEFAEFEPPLLPESETMEFFNTKEATEKSGFGIRKENKATNVFSKTKLIPQMFVETSPVLLGPDTANKLSSANLGGGGKCFLSSPKRYAWDNYSDSNTARLYWTMLRNPWSAQKTSTANPKLESSILRMFPATGFDWEASNPPWEWEVYLRPASNPIEPIYPNGDSLSWMALSILEQASRQINDPSYWENNYPYIPRKLRSVQVTYPSGWTEPELNAYMNKWNKAVNAFNASHFRKESAISLEFPIDEGVASQLPVIFSEIESMGRIGENWISLIGREPEEGFPKARVMTIDIGGGTTDFAIVEYEDHKIGPGVDLHATLLLKDSSSVAGDQMIREIIESVLLPKLGEQHRDDPEWRETYEDLFREGLNSNVDREKWKTITRLGFIPKVVEWISDLVENRRPRAKSGELNISTINDTLIDFAERKEIQGLDLEEPLNVTSEEINAAIEKTFDSLFVELSKFASAFDVDCLVVCGKPSEIPLVSEMLRKLLPVNPLRIIVANEYKIGNWYPFSNAGKIEDAKTLTSVGVCLYKAIQSSMLSGWNITLKNSLVSRYRNCWEIIHEKEHCESILSSDQDENTIRLMNNARLGRRLLKDAKPEFVYQLKWKSEDTCPAQFDARFRRKPATNEYVSEGLELVSVSGQKQDGSSIGIDDFELKLCTLESNEYWIDEARFTVNWGDDDDTDEDWMDF
jgi:hypothetical protein